MNPPSSPFSNKTYLKLFLAQVISLAGTGITTIALALLAWNLAGDRAGEVLGIALALKMVAYVILAPIIGSLAHKLPTKTWLIFLDIVRFFLVLGMIFVTEIWQIYLLIFLINSFASGFTPIFQSTIANIIEDESRYQKALSYSKLAYDLEQLLSPTIAAILLGFVSFNTLFALDALSFLLSAWLITLCTLPIAKKHATSSSFIKNVKFGIASYLKTPRLQGLLAIYVVVASVSGMTIVNTVLYVGKYLQKSDTYTAIALAILGCGSMVVAFLIPKFLTYFTIRTSLLFGAFLGTIGLFLASFMPYMYGFFALWFLLGMALSFMQVPAGSIVRLSCLKEDMTSYFSANFSLSHFCWFIAYLLSGFLGVQIGLSNTFIFFGVISLIFTFLAIKLYPNPDIIELEHTHEEISHEHFFIDDGMHDTNKDKHFHTHKKLTHTHKFVIDLHHPTWAD